MTPPNFVASSGSPITPVDARKTSRRLAAGGRGGDLGGELGRLASGLAGEGIGVAGIDNKRARRAAFELRAAPVDRCGWTFRAREHAGHRRAVVEQRQQDVGAAGIADAGGGGRKLDARHRRHVGKLLPARAGRWRSSRWFEHSGVMPGPVPACWDHEDKAGAPAATRNDARLAPARGRPRERSHELAARSAVSHFFRLGRISARRLCRPACRGARSWRVWRSLVMNSLCALRARRPRSGPSPCRIPAAAWCACPRA